MTSEISHGRRRPVATWILRLIAWDGALPAIVLLVPVFVRLAFPQFPDAIVIFSLALPIVGVFWRMYAGFCHIDANHCGRILRFIQTWALLVGVLTIMLADAFILSLQGLPGVVWDEPDTIAHIATLYGIYICCMTVALYPGTCPTPTESSPTGDAMH